MTAKNPQTCSFSGGSTLRRGDVEMIKRMYGCSGGANLYLPIKNIVDGIHCTPGFKLPGHVTFKTGAAVDVRKLVTIPYGNSIKYEVRFGGFGVAAATPFEGHIDHNNQVLVGTTTANTGLLKFANIQVSSGLMYYLLFNPQVPGWYGSGSWGTSVWIEVRSQCQPSSACESGTQHVWKFEKALSAVEAEKFAFTHVDPDLASGTVSGVPVILQYLGLVPCGAGNAGGSDLFLKIRGVDDGSYCASGFKLPGHSSYKTGSFVDLNKLMNNPYGSSFKYWLKFGGFGLAENIGFEGCVDDNNQQLLGTTSSGIGVLKFANVKVNTTQNMFPNFFC